MAKDDIEMGFLTKDKKYKVLDFEEQFQIVLIKDDRNKEVYYHYDYFYKKKRKLIDFL